MVKTLSIIIPIYNGEEWIRRCIDSVLKQKDFNVKQLEILLINDGSKDGSLRVIEEYRTQHPDIITVVSQSNLGIAKTRNKGIELVTTKWLMFVDQDDVIDADYCATFYNAAESNDYDIVMGGYKKVTNQGKLLQTVRQPSGDYGKYASPMMWGKIHKTEFIKQNHIVTPDIYAEDVGFSVAEINNTKKIKIIPYCGYSHTEDIENVTNTKQRKITPELTERAVKTLDLLKSLDNDTKEHDYFVLQTGVFYLCFTGRNASRQEYMRAYKRVFDWLENNYSFVMKQSYVYIGLKGARPIARIAIASFVILHKLQLMKAFAIVYCKGV